ncbi:MAG: sugar nucleotide-binding protein [Dehalococcoidales bacterium]|nr:sugar nucleotide-binding protein [Dehalococcoidales bacterium]
MSKKVVVLGSSGMLGSMVVDYLSRDSDLKVAATVRTPGLAAKCRERLPGVSWLLFNAGSSESEKALGAIHGYDWVINAIGITKPLIHDDNAAEVERAVLVNSLLPHQIARQAQKGGAKVIQIATDCVYSGNKGGYLESDSHDALDAYGKTKSLGEVTHSQVHHLRCSIIGPEPKERKFLLEWFRGQPQKARISGYVNHRWNGVTTLHFAKLCQGIITQNISLAHLQHVVPAGEVTKCELLQSFALHFKREDISITPSKANVIVDRTLKTTSETMNQALWAAAGYSQPPSIPAMVAEMAGFDYKLGGLSE